MQILIRKILQKGWWSLLLYLVIAGGFLWMYAALFPSISADSAKVTDMMAIFPEDLLKAFDVSPDAFTSFQSFLGMEYYSIIWPILLLVLSISLGAKSIAKEIETGTIEVLLAQPLSRTKLFTAKFIANTINILIFAFASNVLAILLTRIYSIEVSSVGFIIVSLAGFLFGLTVYTVALMVSALSSNGGKVTAVVGAIVAVMYALELVTNIKESLAYLKYFTFFNYFDYKAALIDLTIPAASIAVFGGTILTTFILGLIIFNKRDITT